MSPRGLGRGSGRSGSSRNRRKVSAKVTEKIAETIARKNREADTVYWLSFIPIGKTAPPLGKFHLPSPDDPWRIMLPGNPQSNPNFIPRAIREFEKKHNVKHWRDIATGFDCLHEYTG